MQVSLFWCNLLFLQQMFVFDLTWNFCTAVQAGRPEQKIVTYFMSSEDAADFLNEMTQV